MPRFLVEFTAKVLVKAEDEAEASFLIYDPSQWLGAPDELDVLGVYPAEEDGDAAHEGLEEPEA